MISKKRNQLLIGSAILAGLSFPGNGLGLLSLIAYVPFYYILYTEEFTTKWSKFLVGANFGLIYAIVSLYWIAYSQPAGFLGTLFTIWFRYGIMTFLFLTLVKNKQFFWLIIPFQLIQEYLTMFTELDFAWHLSAYSLTDIPLLIQIAEYFGVFSVSAFIFVSNFMLFRWYLYVQSENRSFPAIFQFCLMFLCYLLLNLLIRYSVDESDSFAIKSGLIQPNIDAWEKWKTEKSRQLSVDRLLNQSYIAIREGADHIVWPETAIPFLRNIKVLEDTLRSVGNRTNTNFTIGTIDYKRTDTITNYYNSSFHYFPGDLSNNAYYKQKLVPVAEKDILPDFLRFLGELPGVGSYSKGTESTVFKSNFKTYENLRGENPKFIESKQLKFSTIICIESNFPNLLSEMKNNGAQWINIITNDGWFYPHFDWFKQFAKNNNFSPFIESKAALQHHRIAIMRAIENRTSIVRATNTGISSIIDPYGNSIETLGLYLQGSIINYVPILNSGLTFYNRYGNFIIYVSMMIVVIVLMNQFSKKYRDKQRL